MVSKLVLSMISAFLLAGVKAEPAMVSFDAQHGDIGVYYGGLVGEENELGADFEALVGIAKKGTPLRTVADDKSIFILRSSDLKFRAKVTLYDVPDQSDRPFGLAFKNLAQDDPTYHVELKHSSSGFQWLPPGGEVAHATDYAHSFELRNGEKKSLVSVRLDRVPKEL